MAMVKPGDRVKIDFTGKLENGKVFGTSKGRKPFTIKIGKGTTFPKLEKAIVGMQTGEVKSVAIEPEAGFGHWDERLVLTVDKTKLPKGIRPQAGATFQTKDMNGDRVHLKIVEAGEKTVRLDTNHPLAGQKMFFEIKLLEIM